MEIKDTTYEETHKVIQHPLGKIEILQYLPAEQKSNLLKDVGKYCFKDKLLDRPRMDAIFNAFIALYYTNIEFNYSSASELMKFYDYLEAKNIMRSVITSLPAVEYESLVNYFLKTVGDIELQKSKLEIRVEKN